MRRSSLLCVVLVFLLLLIPVSATAAQMGSLLILEIDHPVCVYRVIDADGKITEAFADSGLMPNIADPVAAAKALQKYVKENNISGQMKVPVRGEAYYASMEEGTYLVCSLHREGEFAPFLLSIPTRLNGEVVYHVEAKPKSDDTPPETETTCPTETRPSGSDIPQTGDSVIPKYALLILGTLTTLLGLYQVLSGREETRYD